MGTGRHSSIKSKGSKKSYGCIEDYRGMPKEITEILESESDRGVILILAAYLEELLGLIIKESCISDNDADKILELGKPAGDFGSKRILSAAFGLIHKEESEALKIVQNIRNRAAHFDRKKRGFKVLFDSGQTVDQVKAFSEKMNIRLLSRKREDVRTCFILVSRLLATKLYVRLCEATRPKQPETLKQIANKARIQMKDTTIGKIISQAENEAKKGNLEPLCEVNETMKKYFLGLLNNEEKGNNGP